MFIAVFKDGGISMTYSNELSLRMNNKYRMRRLHLLLSDDNTLRLIKRATNVLAKLKVIHHVH